MLQVSTMESLVMSFALSLSVLLLHFCFITNQYNGKSRYDISTVSLSVADPQLGPLSAHHQSVQWKV